MLEDCVDLDIVMFNKDITHPDMLRMIRNPRVMAFKQVEEQDTVSLVRDGWCKALACDNVPSRGFVVEISVRL